MKAKKKTIIEIEFESKELASLKSLLEKVTGNAIGFKSSQLNEDETKIAKGLLKEID